MPRDRIDAVRTLHVKYEGTDSTLEVAAGDETSIAAEFERRYRQQYGFLMPGRALVVEAIAVEAIGKPYAPGDNSLRFAARSTPLRAIKTARHLQRRRDA